MINNTIQYIKLYNQGWSTNQISENFGVNIWNVRAILKKNGIILRSRKEN